VEDAGVFIDQPVKNFDWKIEFDGAWHINESPGRTWARCSAANLAEPSAAGWVMKCFANEIFVLDQCAFQRLKNYPGRRKIRKGVRSSN